MLRSAFSESGGRATESAIPTVLLSGRKRRGKQRVSGRARLVLSEQVLQEPESLGPKRLSSEVPYRLQDAVELPFPPRLGPVKNKDAGVLYGFNLYQTLTRRMALVGNTPLGSWFQMVA